jgi:hypothetical protein
MGVPAAQQRLMPDQLARSIAGTIAEAKPEDAAKQLQAVADEFGPYWPKAFRQMGKLIDGHARVAATVADKGSAALLIEGSRQDVGALRKAVGVQDGILGIAQAVADDGRVQDLATSLSQRAGGSGTATQVAKSIEVLALQRMRTFGEDQATATETAIQKVVTDRYDFGSGVRPFRVPRSAGDVDAISTGARGFQASLKVDDVDAPPDAGEARESYTDAVRRNGYWVTNDDETGAILYSERGVPVTKGGKPISRTWGELGRGADDAPWRSFEGLR